jgi:hypothetical protein
MATLLTLNIKIKRKDLEKFTETLFRNRQKDRRTTKKEYERKYKNLRRQKK